MLLNVTCEASFPMSLILSCYFSNVIDFISQVMSATVSMLLMWTIDLMLHVTYVCNGIDVTFHVTLTLVLIFSVMLCRQWY